MSILARTIKVGGAHVIEPIGKPPMQKRAVVCHYHLYKNSGTSFSALLRENFGERHVEFDGPIASFQINQDQLAEIVESNSEILSVSSHQIYLPAPSTLNVHFIPVMILRHPMLRIRSIYLFENQVGDASFLGEDISLLLQGFEKWARDRLATQSGLISLSNLQTNQLSRAYCRAPQMDIRDKACFYDLDLAINNLKLVSCIARTEHYADDIAHFGATLADYGLAFDSDLGKPENVSASDFDKAPEDQLETFKSSMTRDLWQELCRINSQDQALYDAASTLIQVRAKRGGRAGSAFDDF